MKRAAIAWVVAAVACLRPAPAAAGSGPASLSCAATAKDKDRKAGGLTLRGLIPATDAELDLTLSDGAASLAMTPATGDTVQVVEAFGDGVFTVAVARKDGRALRLYA